MQQYLVIYSFDSLLWHQFNTSAVWDFSWHIKVTQNLLFQFYICISDQSVLVAYVQYEYILSITWFVLFVSYLPLTLWKHHVCASTSSYSVYKLAIQTYTNKITGAAIINNTTTSSQIVFQLEQNVCTAQKVFMNAPEWDIQKLETWNFADSTLVLWINDCSKSHRLSRYLKKL